MEIQSKRLSIDNISLFLYFFIYFTVGSYLALPKTEILRWVVSFQILFIGLIYKIKNNEMIIIWPKYFNFLIPTYIISIFTLEYALFYGIKRLLSFILVISSLFIFMDRKSFTQKKIEKSFSLMAHIINIIMIYQFIILVMTGFNIGHFQGIYANKNMLSSLSLTAIISSLWLFYRNENRKILSVIYILSSIVVCIAAGSRVGIIGLGTIFIYSILIFNEQRTLKRKFKNMFKFIFFAFLFILIIKYLDIPALNRILHNNYSDGSTGLTRGNVWKNGIQIFKSKPLFGWGYGSANYHVFVDNPSPFSGWGVHNSYLIILIENGIIGSFNYLLFFLAPFINIIRKRNRINEANKLFLDILLLLCIVVLLNGIAESFLFSVGNPMAIPFWYSLIAADRYISKKVI